MGSMRIFVTGGGLMFKEESSQTTYIHLSKSVFSSPLVIFTRKAAKWIKALVMNHDTEVGFYGLVDMMENNVYRVSEIFYPKHNEANGATCEISPEGETQLMEELLARPDGEKLISKVILWGHSHNTMVVFASSQDETQAIQRMDSTHSIVIRIIVNKSMDMSISIFDPEKCVKFDKVHFKVEDTESDAYYESVISKINECATMPNVLAKDRVDQIRKLVETDSEYEEIKSQVIVLKEKNMPVKTPYSYSTPGFNPRDSFVPDQFDDTDYYGSGDFSNDKMSNYNNQQINLFNQAHSPVQKLVPFTKEELDFYHKRGYFMGPRPSLNEHGVEIHRGKRGKRGLRKTGEIT